MPTPLGNACENTCHGKSDVIDEETAVVVKVAYVYEPTTDPFDGHDMAAEECGLMSLVG